jgi:hypothetical protein
MASMQCEKYDPSLLYSRISGLLSQANYSKNLSSSCRQSNTTYFYYKMDILSHLSTSIFHKNIYKVKQSLGNILNRQNMGGNIANEHYQSKLMLSGDIDLNPGPTLCNSFQTTFQLNLSSIKCNAGAKVKILSVEYLYILFLHIQDFKCLQKFSNVIITEYHAPSLFIGLSFCFLT